jgi:hypothetical protein
MFRAGLYRRVLLLEQFDPGVSGLSKVQVKKALAGRAP